MSLVKINQLIILIFFIISLTACENIFNDIADKTSDEAVYFEARKQLNQRNFTTSIDLMGNLSADFLAQRDVNLTYASAHSGRCGLDFFPLATQIEDNLSSAASIYLFLTSLFLGDTDTTVTDARIVDCQTSETALTSIGNETVRNADENILLGFSSLVKIGTLLNRYADLDNDGTVDAGFDNCDPGQLPEAAVREIGSGTALAILSAEASAASLNPDLLGDITGLCAVDPLLNTFCTTTDPSAYSALEVQALRTIIGMTDFGLGVCVGTILACLCP